MSKLDKKQIMPHEQDDNSEKKGLNNSLNNSNKVCDNESPSNHVIIETSPSPSVPEPATQLKEIRDLLFGEQVREIQQQISALTQAVEQQFNHLNQQLEQKLSLLAQNTQNQLADLTKQMQYNDQQQQNTSSVLESELTSLSDDLKSFQQQTETTELQLLTQIKSDNESLLEQLMRQQQETQSALTEINNELSHGREDRRTIARLFRTVASVHDEKTISEPTE